MKHESCEGGKGKVVAGVAALVAAAAGAYYLYGTKEGAKHRKKMKSWMLRMKADVMDRLEEAKDINEEMYSKIVDEVTARYKQVKDIDPEELSKLVDRMKAHWEDIKADLEEFDEATKDSSKKSGK